MIRFINVCKKDKKYDKNILNNINLSIADDEFVYIYGPHGAGKSTLLKLLYRGTDYDKGRIIFHGKNLDDIKIHEHRKDIGIIFQDLKLLKKRTVFQNVIFPLDIINFKGKEDRVLSMLKYMNLLDKKDYKVCDLSGTEKQKVAISRAVITKPKLLICDAILEKFDRNNKEHIMRLLSSMNGEKTTIIFSTRDKDIIERYPKRVIKINEGVIENG
ncbi:MAG: cell division ATP-binding protein FtsE [Fusobacteriota bacterium]